MRRRTLARRLDGLDGGGGLVYVRLEIRTCRTQQEQDRAFAQAWKRVPAGAVVWCVPELTEAEYLAAASRHVAGLPPLINYRCGIYLKTLSSEAQ